MFRASLKPRGLGFALLTPFLLAGTPPQSRAALVVADSLFPVPCLLLAAAQNPTVIRLVPAVNWRLVGSEVMTLDAVRKYGGDPAIEREYGVQSLQRQTYQLDHMLSEVIVEQTPDASSSYGLLTYYHSDAMTPEKGMDLTLSSPKEALMARGSFFIRVIRPSSSEFSDVEFHALLVFVSGTRPATQGMVKLPVAFPPAGLIPSSVKYLLGPEATRHVLPAFRADVIGFSLGAEVETAAYTEGNGRVKVMAITYPTPQIARLQFANMERTLGVNKNQGSEPMYGRRNGSFVFLVLNSSSQTRANKVMDQFLVSNSVSWDRPYPGDKPIVLQVAELILANMAFVLILVGFAIAGGVFIVVFKWVIGKMFPHSIWAHPDEGTFIRLGLR